MEGLNGALVLGANSPVERLYLFNGGDSGIHVEGRHRGTWLTNYGAECTYSELAVPHRDNYYKAAVLHGVPNTASTLTQRLGEMDSEYKGARYHFKMNLVRERLNREGHVFAAVVNNTSTHGAFTLIGAGHPIYFWGLVDVEGHADMLLWSSDSNTVYNVLNRYPLRYVIYPFPVVDKFSVFLSTQALCSRWWKWSKRFENHPHQKLLLFNLLQVRLYKDPEIQSFDPEHRAEG